MSPSRSRRYIWNPSPMTEPRHELKYVYDGARSYSLQQELVVDGFALRRSYPDRVVRNVYFDTVGLSCYAESLAGVSKRSKLRLRWYGEMTNAESATVEVKRRLNQLGWKDQYRVGALTFDKGNWRLLRQRLRSALPPKAWLLFDRLQMPVLLNSYKRSYYETLDSKVRLTIDRDLIFFDQRLRSAPNTRFDRYEFAEPIFEIKCSVEDRGLASRIAKRLGLRRVRMSKYCTGVGQFVGER